LPELPDFLDLPLFWDFFDDDGFFFWLDVLLTVSEYASLSPKSVCK
jgi:hypothetical protein